VPGHRPLVRVLSLPDLDRPIGGVKQLYRHVEHLVALGWDAAIVTEKTNFHPSWFDNTAPTIALSESQSRHELCPDKSILILPETYIGLDLENFYGINIASLGRVVFNQNAYYSYGKISAETEKSLFELYNSDSVLQVLSVSENTHTFLSRNIGLPDNRLSRIINAVEPIFHSADNKTNKMHWMTRKNPEHVNAIMMGIKRSNLQNSSGWQGKPLENISHMEVAEHLRSARIFLAFGHPEGFGLPIAEAMAAGCWVVGYSGGGGDELFRLGAGERVSFGDWPEYLASIQRAFNAFADQPRETQMRLTRQSLAVRSLYSYEQEQLSIKLAWERVYKAFTLWRNDSTS